MHKAFDKLNALPPESRDKVLDLWAQKMMTLKEIRNRFSSQEKSVSNTIPPAIPENQAL